MHALVVLFLPPTPKYNYVPVAQLDRAGGTKTSLKCLFWDDGRRLLNKPRRQPWRV